MRKISFLALLLLVALGFLGFMLSGNETGSPHDAVTATPGGEKLADEQHESSIVSDPTSTNYQSRYSNEPDWLFSKEAENDPEIKRAARIAGTTPACVIAEIKERMLGEAPNPDCPPRTPVESEQPLQIEVSPVFERYSIEELKLLAQVEPDAAIILARRTKDDHEARKYYEQALVLRGNAEPLKEWLFSRDTAGLEWTNNELDVEKAKVAYEAWLVVAAFGGAPGPARSIRDELVKHGHDPTAIEQDSVAHIAELVKKRKTIFRGEY